MKPHCFPFLAFTLMPWIASAQQAQPNPAPAVAAPTELPSTLPPGVSLDPGGPGSPVVPVPAQTKTDVQTVEQPAGSKGGIRLNFQGAALNDVLNYLSEAAGFVIVQDAPVTGTVNITSRQPVSADEAVDLLNTVLVSKGYVAIRAGRILKIVSRSAAAKSAIPVIVGSDPARIPQKDEMVTQILPVRYVEAAKLVDNLRPLLSETSQIGANESSNAILMTDTQVNIRRIAEIISALDTSVSGASGIRIFGLHFADAKQLADVITQLFSGTQSATGAQGGNQGGGGGRGGFGGGPGGFGGGRGGGGGAAAATASSARQQAAKVVAVADQQSNSVIVSAPDDVMPTIADIITRTDTNITETSETRIFALKQADATEMAGILTSLYSGASGGTTNQQNNQRGVAGGQGRGQGGQQQAPQAAANNQLSQRALLQAQVVAVADARTNSVIVTASRNSMLEIAEMIGRLDATGAKKQRVFTEKLDYADADNVATILQSMFGNQSSVNSQPSTNRLNQRTTTGASSDVTDAVNLNSTRSTSTGR